MTKVVMAMARSWVIDTLREPGDVFEVPDDLVGRYLRELPGDALGQHRMKAEALHVPQRPEIEMQAQAKLAKAKQMGELGFGDTVVPGTTGMLPEQHQEAPEPEPQPRPRPKTRAKS